LSSSVSGEKAYVSCCSHFSWAPTRSQPLARAMVIKCKTCGARTGRKDGSRLVPTCTKQNMDEDVVGRIRGLGVCWEAALDSWARSPKGGHILRLSDRHDIRVGIASGMYLKGRVPEDRVARDSESVFLALVYEGILARCRPALLYEGQRRFPSHDLR